MKEFNKQLTATVQGRLADLGFYRGQIDGLAGAMTLNAMSDFKEVNGLRARPMPGPITLSLLWSNDAKSAPAPAKFSDAPPWLVEARRLLGTREFKGKGNNPVIMRWARDLDQWYPGDDVPWCGLFVAHCMSVGAPDEPQSFNRLGARAWLNYGVPSDVVTGAIAIFWRTHKTKSWNGHVAIVEEQTQDAIRVVGGNQSDNVTSTWIAKSRLLGCRVPEGYVGVPAPMRASREGPLSQNEA